MKLEPHIKQGRQNLADSIAAALREMPCCQPQEGWRPAVITQSFTTSGCPIVRIEFGPDDAFNITITRARS